MTAQDRDETRRIELGDRAFIAEQQENNTAGIATPAVKRPAHKMRRTAITKRAATR
jgi:hypothetical protein